MTPETEKRLAEIREREKKTMAAPWALESRGPDVKLIFSGVKGERERKVACFYMGDGDHLVTGDFIANARQDIPYLLSIIDDLLAENKVHKNKKIYWPTV